jgi:hypothetical protein
VPWSDRFAVASSPTVATKWIGDGGSWRKALIPIGQAPQQILKLPSAARRTERRSNTEMAHGTGLQHAIRTHHRRYPGSS